MKHFVSHCRKLLTVLVLAGVAGCGPGPGATISGHVTLDGKPLTKGTIVFHPVVSAALATGHIDSDGHYVINTGTTEGLAPGDYLVAIVATEGDLTLPSPSNPNPTGKRLAPARYARPKTSGLKYSITAGNNVIDIDLRSD